VSRITSIADALVSLLNSSASVRNIQAVREDSGPIDTRDDLRGLVIVWPQAEDRLLYSRAKQQLTYTIAVNVNGVAAAESIYEVDDLLTLCDEVKTAIEFQTVSDTAAWVTTTHEPLYDRELLQTQRKFSANLLFQFREVA